MSEVTGQSELDEDNDDINEVEVLQAIEDVMYNDRQLRSVDEIRSESTHQANITALNHFNKYFAFGCSFRFIGPRLHCFAS